MKWYIGQTIVSIKDSLCGKIKKGQEFKVLGLIENCRCGLMIDIGLRSQNYADYWLCTTCGMKRPYDYIRWKSESLFAPLDQDISELTELLTQKQPVNN